MNPKGFVYVGQSVNIERRFNQYKKMSNCKEQRLLFNSFKKYGTDAHTFEVLEYCESKNLNKREQYYIDFFNALDRNFGLNIRNAGSNGKHSEGTKKKISEANKGKKRTKEQRIKISEAKKKNPTKFWLGKIRSLEDVEKFKKSHLGKVNSNKPIIQYDKNMNELNRFDGATDASRKLNISRSSIKNNLRKYCKTCNGSIFKYVPL